MARKKNKKGRPKNPAELLIFGNPSGLKEATAMGRKAGTAKRRGDDARAGQIIAHQSKFVSSQPEVNRKPLVEAFNTAYQKALRNPAKGTKFNVHGKKYRASSEADAKKRALRDRKLRGQRAAKKTFGNPMDAHDRKHLSAWIKSAGYRGKEASEVRRKILAVVKQYPEVIESPGSRSWPEILRMSNPPQFVCPRPGCGQKFTAAEIEAGKLSKHLAEHRAKDQKNPRRNARRNPSETEEAVRLFESFQGKDAKSIVEKQVSAAMRLDYAALGDLEKLIVVTPIGDKVDFNFEGDGVKLASSPDGKQLYCIGGNQNISKCLDADSLQKDFIDVGECVQVEYLARKVHANFEPVSYYHKLGEKTGDRPRLMFDKLRKQLFFVGGAYYIDTSKGVSPGIEN